MFAKAVIWTTRSALYIDNALFDDVQTLVINQQQASQVFIRNSIIHDVGTRALYPAADPTGLARELGLGKGLASVDLAPASAGDQTAPAHEQEEALTAARAET